MSPEDEGVVHLCCACYPGSDIGAMVLWNAECQVHGAFWHRRGIRAPNGGLQLLDASPTGFTSPMSRGTRDTPSSRSN